MPIPLVCPYCKKQSQAPDGSQGVVLNCPHCSGKIKVPDQPATGPVADMINFYCPTCNSPVAAKRNWAGQKVFCPGCTQKLKVPEPKDRTVLGSLTPNDPNTGTQAVPLKVPQSQQPLGPRQRTGGPVTVNISANIIIDWPQFCACCLSPSNTSTAVYYERTTGVRVIKSQEWSWEVPYCRQCLEHVRLFTFAQEQHEAAAAAEWQFVYDFAMVDERFEKECKTAEQRFTAAEQRFQEKCRIREDRLNRPIAANPTIVVLTTLGAIILPIFMCCCSYSGVAGLLMPPSEKLAESKETANAAAILSLGTGVVVLVVSCVFFTLLGVFLSKRDVERQRKGKPVMVEEFEQWKQHESQRLQQWKRDEQLRVDQWKRNEQIRIEQWKRDEKSRVQQLRQSATTAKLKAEKAATPACAIRQEIAVSFDEKYGSVSTFTFQNSTYAQFFVENNKDKIRDVR